MKHLHFLILILAVSLIFSACSGGEKVDRDTETETVTETEEEPQTETVAETEEKIDYATLGKTPFRNLSPSPETDFEIAENETCVTVTGYVGTDEKVRIPDSIGGKSVTAIGDSAFGGNTTVRVLWIPDTVTTFGGNILAGTTSLYAIHTPIPNEDGKQFLGWLFGAKSYETNNVEDLRRIDFLEIGGTADTLPDYALFDCNDLVTVTLCDNITKIGVASFARCASLKSVNLEKIKTVGKQAFVGCTSLTDITFSTELKQIGFEALGNCNALENLILPFVGESRTTNTHLGWLFGAETSSLSAGLYPSSLSAVTILSGCEKICENAFASSPIRNLTIEDGTTEIGDRAFADCTKLSELHLPDGISKIGAEAFADCKSLKKITLPNGLISLGAQVFLNCEKLETVVLPASLESLPNGCFLNCRKLTTVNLDGIKTVGADTFRNCTSFTTTTK